MSSRSWTSRIAAAARGALCAASLLIPGALLAAEEPGRDAADGPAVAREVRLGGDGTRTRFVVDLSRPVQLTAFTLADPYRVVLDLPAVEFRLPPKTGESGRGLVKAFRFGMVTPGGSRMVLDATGPVRIDKAFVLDPVDGQPSRMVLELVSVDRAAFLRNTAEEAKNRQGGPRLGKEREAPPSPDDARPVVVIDPGHGGLDSGTSGPSGEAEKSLVLEFAQELRARLEKSDKVRVVLTRTDDSFVTLSERVRIARLNGAALFISIHADAIARADSETRGATIYTLSQTASGAQAGRLAEAENRADVIAGVDLSTEPGDVADILIDLAQRETKSFSTQFARTLVTHLKPAVRLHKHPLQSAGFKVLRAPDVPSVLVELGYVSSTQDLRLLTSDVWRKRAAEAVAQAVTSFFATRLAGNSGGRASP